jgi:UDP-glucose 4-epimerase
MMRWLHRGIPLPFGAIDNRRSLVAVANLADLLAVCLVHPAAAGQRFLVSDGHDLSTSELLRQLATALGRPARLLPVPQRWLEGGARLLGREDMGRRLCGSLQVDISKTRELLNWHPPLAVERGLASAATRFLDSQNR